ncbi:MAG: Na+/H+ antiporter NhaA [Desulfuromonadales bacterium]|nr:Na+/H+ antiporter NhaA [Desulfuromonadales bacterium]
MFAFAKAGIPLGIMLGLAQMPQGSTTRHLLGVAALCGIGFTMSIFIGGLAFEHVGGDATSYILTHRLGILSGSIIAGVLGYMVIRTAPAGQAAAVTEPVVEPEEGSGATGEEQQPAGIAPRG